MRNHSQPIIKTRFSVPVIGLGKTRHRCNTHAAFRRTRYKRHALGDIMQSAKISARAGVALAVIAFTHGAPTQAAEDASTAETAHDTIIITGTRRTDRTVSESTVPVGVFSADDLKSRATSDIKAAKPFQRDARRSHRPGPRGQDPPFRRVERNALGHCGISSPVAGEGPAPSGVDPECL